MKSKPSPNVLFIILLVLLAGIHASGQNDFEKWKQQRQQQLQDFEQQRKAQIAGLAEKFDRYIKQQDEAYANYLTERWKQFQAFKGIARPAAPKPDIIPVYREPEQKKPPQQLPRIKDIIKIDQQIPAKPLLPRPVKQEPENFPVYSGEIIFYGNSLPFAYDRKMNIRVNEPIDENSISDYFEQLSLTSYNSLLDQLQEYSNQMNLNDWGFYRLIRQVAGAIAGQEQNTSRLLTWFLLLRSGYQAKAAFYENETFVLLPVVNPVYGTTFFLFDNQKYYLMEGEADQLRSYEMDFPEAHRLFDLNIYKVLNLGGENTAKTFTFGYEQTNFDLQLSCNNQIINFYKDYPQSDIVIYFDAMVSNELKLSLIGNFAPLIAEKSELEAVSLLLKFVQTAFSYQTDQEQFGFEKFFFADEVLHYPYSDCEDRSVLFAYLVKSLLGLDVIGLNFPGHIATAVNFNEPVEGDYIVFDGKKFTIADPTYINAPVGLTMPDYIDKEAEILVLHNPFGAARNQHKIWDELIAAGAGRGDNRTDLLTVGNEQTLVTGYFSDTLNFKGIRETSTGNPAMFTMLLDHNNRPVWFNRSTGNGKALAYSAAVDQAGNLLTAGTFSGELKLGNFTLESKEARDIFVAKFDKNGRPVWLSKAALNEITPDNLLNFVAKFSPDGKHLGNDLYFETPGFEHSGLNISSTGEVCFTGSFNRSTGMNIMEETFAAGGEFNIIEQLRDENDNLIRQNYEKTIAGLFAAVRMIHKSNVSIPGRDIQKLFDRYNPSFKNEFPNIYTTIGSILFIKNQEGIVTIRTESNKGISIDMMRVDNDAKIKIVMLDSGDARLDVISGMRVGKAIWWFTLNYVMLYHQNGNLLFDYDTDNTQAVRNLRNDILY